MGNTGRKPRPPTTRLGLAMVARRGSDSQSAAARQARLPQGTFSRMEQGTHQPSFDTAVVLARWLGWTVEQVYEAARAELSKHVV